MTELIPSPSAPDALAAMERLIVDGTRIRAAVAFVTEAGVKTLRGLVDGRDEITLELVARAADVTDPVALLALRHDLDAVVSASSDATPPPSIRSCGCSRPASPSRSWPARGT